MVESEKSSEFLILELILSSLSLIDSFFCYSPLSSSLSRLFILCTFPFSLPRITLFVSSWFLLSLLRAGFQGFCYCLSFCRLSLEVHCTVIDLCDLCVILFWLSTESAGNRREKIGRGPPLFASVFPFSSSPLFLATGFDKPPHRT